MAITKAFAGTIYDEGNVPIANCYLQAYWKANLAGSSASAWSAVMQADGNGFYSFDVADWLTPGGNGGPGDEVIIAVWTGAPTRASTNLTLYSYKVFTISASDTYVEDLIACANVAPAVSMSAPATVNRLTNFTVTNSSYGQGTSLPGGMVQTELYQGIVVFIITGVRYLEYELDSVSQGATFSGTANLTLQLAQGSHVLRFRVQDYEGLWSSWQTININSLFLAPVGGLSFNPVSPRTTDQTTCIPNITDVDGRVSSVDYSVSGVTVQTGLGPTSSWSHLFTLPGIIPVVQTIHWNNGFQNQTVILNTTITVIYEVIVPTNPYSRAGIRNRIAIFYSLDPTDTQVQELLNECIQTGYEKTISIINQHTRQVALSTWSVASQRNYTVPNLGVPTYVGYKTTRLKYLPYPELAEKFANFTDDVGDPVYYSLSGFDGYEKTVHIWPTPKETNTAIDFLCLQMPPVLASDSDYPLLPVEWAWLVVERGKIERLRFEGQGDQYQIQGQEFVAYLKAMIVRAYPATPEPFAEFKKDPGLAVYNQWRMRR